MSFLIAGRCFSTFLSVFGFENGCETFGYLQHESDIEIGCESESDVRN